MLVDDGRCISGAFDLSNVVMGDGVVVESVFMVLSGIILFIVVFSVI